MRTLQYLEKHNAHVVFRSIVLRHFRSILIDDMRVIFFISLPLKDYLVGNSLATNRKLQDVDTIRRVAVGFVGAVPSFAVGADLVASCRERLHKRPLDIIDTELDVPPLRDREAD